MKNIILKLSILFSVLLSPSLLLPASALAFNPLGTACNGVSGSSVCDQNSTQQSSQSSNPVVTLIAKAGRIISIVIGIVAVIMIVVSGLSLIISGGNAEEVTKAKNRIINSIIGLVIAALAWVITTFVINHVA